jgi:hypothetical protein
MVWQAIKTAATYVGGAVVKGAKGAAKVIRKIGKNIRKTVKRVGKFMDKVRIAGTAGVMMVLPGVGGALADKITATTSALFGPDHFITNGVTNLFDFMGKAVTTGKNVFTNITKGVMDTVVNFSKTAAKKLGFNVEGAADNFFGEGDTAWNRSFTDTSARFQNLTASEDKIKLLNQAFDEAGNASGVFPEGRFAITPEDQISGVDPYKQGRFAITPEDQISGVDPYKPVTGSQSAVYNNNNLLTDMPDRKVEMSLNIDKDTGLVEIPKTAEVPKPSLLSRGYEATKKSVVEGYEGAKEAVVDSVKEAPATVAQAYIDKEVAEYVYGDEDEVVYDDSGSYGYGSANVIQAQTVQGYTPQISANQFMQSYAPVGQYGYTATQSNVYGQRMGQFYKPAII